jgi:hypothetical protein
LLTALGWLLLQDIQVFGSHSWPSATWVLIGNFTAQNVKKIQHFSLPETVWFKYGTDL